MQQQEIIQALVQEMERLKHQSIETILANEALAPFEIYGEDEAEKLENLALAIELFEQKQIHAPTH